MIFYSTKEIEALDNVAVESGLQIRQMMELAGFHMVSVFEKERVPKNVAIVIVCGKGNKGGDGLSAARHLINHGWGRVSVILADTELKPDPAHHLALLKNIGIPVRVYGGNLQAAQNEIAHADVIIDSLIGYHLAGAPRGVFAELISQIGESVARVIAYDVPSGADATTGICAGACIMASATLTLAVPKKFFETEEGRAHSGVVYVADIGIPGVFYDRVIPASRPDFRGEGVIKA